MSTITIHKKELKSVIKESVSEAIAQELAKFRALALPFVSQKEQKDIEKKYIKPTRKTAKSIAIEL